MKFKDYLFYRMYINYKKANEGRFSAIIFFTIIEYCILSPIIIFITELINLNNDWDWIPMFFPLVIIFLLNCKRYYRKGKVEELKKKYKDSKYNNLVKNWVIYSLIFMAIAWGMIGVGIGLRLFSYFSEIF